MAKPPPLPSQLPATDSGLPPLLQPSARVLVVDDSPTIRKVVGHILRLHSYEPVPAGDGVEAMELLQTAGPFDLILLDFVMPRMNGYQFCRELRTKPEYAAMPVVLISARAETIGDRFVEQTGAADALAKPFDARALVAVVGAVLAKAKEGVARHKPEAEEMLDEEELDAPESLAYSSQHRSGLGIAADLISRAIAPALRGLTPVQLKQPDSLSEILTRALDDDLVAALAGVLGAPSRSSSKVILEGKSPNVPLAEVLQLLQLQRQSGVLRVRRKDRLMTMSISEGMIQLVQSQGTKDEFRLGRYFVQQGLLTFEEIDQVLAQAPEGALMGEALIQAGRITEEQLKKSLAKQSCELVYEMMRWPECRFELSDEPFPREARSAQLDLGISALVLEGFRRVDEWRVMEKSIEFDQVLNVDAVALETLDADKIGEKEQRILDAIDGKRTVQEVITASTLASFDAIRAIYGLLQSRMIRSKKEKKKGSTRPMPD